jgi:exopolysaccharide production protein ExoQ
MEQNRVLGRGRRNARAAETTRSRVFEVFLPSAILVLLPVAGLLAGPLYAPLVFGLGAVEFVYVAVDARRVPPLDWRWLALGALFAGLCWTSAAWSIVPERTLHGALQLTAVLLAAVVALASPPLPGSDADRLMRAIAVAFLAGGVLIAADTAAGFALQRLLTGGAANAPTKYNRGVDYAVLIAWPVLGSLFAQRAWRSLAAFALGLALMLAATVSLTARIAALAGAAVLLLSWLVPRATARALAAGTMLVGATAPFLLRVASEHRQALAPYLKQSGQVRLEIWNYMTARVLERPLFGWGFWSADAVPIRARELESYLWVGPGGIYPHNQWLELWLETGVAGAALGVAFALLVLRRVRGLPTGLRPCACAAFAAAAAVSFADYDLATDSWWAALAATAVLFRMAAAAMASQRG